MSVLFSRLLGWQNRLSFASWRHENPNNHQCRYIINWFEGTRLNESPLTFLILHDSANDMTAVYVEMHGSKTLEEYFAIWWVCGRAGPKTAHMWMSTISANSYWVTATSNICIVFTIVSMAESAVIRVVRIRNPNGYLIVKETAT